MRSKAMCQRLCHCMFRRSQPSLTSFTLSKTRLTNYFLSRHTRAWGVQGRSRLITCCAVVLFSFRSYRMVACDCVFDAKVHSSPFLVLVFFSYSHLLVQLLPATQKFNDDIFTGARHGRSSMAGAWHGRGSANPSNVGCSILLFEHE